MMFAAVVAIHLACGAEWLEKAALPDAEAISWVKRQLKEDRQLEKLRGVQKDVATLGAKKCQTNSLPTTPEADIPVYVMISFSVPGETWVGLSTEMEKIGAVFVLRGLPNNSFKELSQRVQHLNQLGVKAPIQINPNLFTTHNIERVPTFLIVEKERSDKVTGNISLSYAVKKMGGLGK